MVSTRHMSIGNNVNENHNNHPNNHSPSQQIINQPESFGPARFTRNSANLLAIYGGKEEGSGGGGASTSSKGMKEGSTFNEVQSFTRARNPPVQTINLLDLPPEIVEKIFSFLSFKEICKIRLVCRHIDQVCGYILNSSFLKLQNQMLQRFQDIKSKMPRRESARRSHYLACESDIIETLHMRLTLLQMSFGKHIERKHICFFAGEILDEVYSILHYIKTTPKLDLPYKVTDELFDLSTMAMEYFKEKIEPNLPEIAYFSTDFLKFSSTSTNKYGLESSDVPAESSIDQNDIDGLDSEELIEIPQSNMVLRKRIRKIKQGMKKYNNQLTVLRQELKGCKKKTSDQQKQISDQQKQLADQQKQTLEYATRLDEYDKKNDEISRKFSTLLQELNKCKTELQYWRCKSSVTHTVCNTCGNSVLPQAEELQVLMNQGVHPEVLGIQQPTVEEKIENPDQGTNEPIKEELLLLENNVELEVKIKDKNVEVVAPSPTSPSVNTNNLRGNKRKSVDTNDIDKPAKKKSRQSAKRKRVNKL